MAVSNRFYPFTLDPTEHALGGAGKGAADNFARTISTDNVLGVDLKELYEHKKEQLGTEDFCAVYSNSKHPKFTVKVVQFDGLNKDFMEFAELKLNTICRFSHPGIIRYHKVVRNGNVIFIIADYCDRDLEQFIADRRIACRSISKELFLSILGQLTDALAYLHNPDKVDRGGHPLSSIVHRNLKPTSILFRERDNRVVITNFGLCGGDLLGSATNANDPTYMAPETLLYGDIIAASDVWNLGVIAYELATLRKPDFLGDKEPTEVFVAGWKPDLSDVTDDFIRSILEKILVLDLTERPTAKKLAHLLRMPNISIDGWGPQNTALEDRCTFLDEPLSRANNKIAFLERELASRSTLMLEEMEESSEPDEPEEESLVEEDDSTELMRAADRNDVAEARSLVPLQGSVQMTGRAFVGEFEMRKGTALMRAAARGHAEIVRLLVEKEGGMKDRGGWTALMWAARTGRADCVRLLLGKEAGMQDKNGWTALMRAAARGHTDCLKLLLERETNMKDSEGWTALIWAAHYGQTDCVRLLVGNEAGMQDNEGWTALMSAAKNGRIDCLKLLLDEEGGRNNDDGETALMLAARNGYPECVKLLVEKEGGMQNTNGWTALIVAAEHGEVGCVKLLLEREGGMQKNDGTTALMWAAKNGQTDCVRLLVEKEVGMQDNSGWTALIFATQTGRINCVRLLMKEKNLKDNKGGTALRMARLWRHHEIIALLAE